MYAVIDVGSKQYKVKTGDIIETEIMPFGDDKKIKLDKVLLVSDKEGLQVGKPYLSKAFVLADVLGEFRDEKKITYKYRRRKSSHNKKGHRQDLLRLKIKEISA